VGGRHVLFDLVRRPIDKSSPGGSGAALVNQVTAIDQGKGRGEVGPFNLMLGLACVEKDFTFRK